MSAILFGSISTLVDTSELQRRAFNEAFEAHGLDWQWSQPDYVAMLDSNGGAQRIADYAESRGDDVDADAVHATKSQIFQELLATTGLKPRAGVLATVEEAQRRDVKARIRHHDLTGEHLRTAGGAEPGHRRRHLRPDRGP